MASISQGKTGSARILFVCPTSTTQARRTIRPGRLNKHDQLRWKGWIESLVNSKKLSTAIEPRAVSWLASLPDRTYAKIAAAGLVPPREKKEEHRTDLIGFFEEYLASRQIKGSTLTTYNQTKQTLTEYFGAKAVLTDITPSKAEKFRDWMTKERLLAPVTASRRLKLVKHAMKKAVKWKLLEENPFDDVKPGPQTNSARQTFISQETTEKVIAACPNDEWKAIVALARYGGLRCPTEIVTLRWKDIDWDRKRFKVYSTKNERFENKREREVPLFAELEPHLKKLHDEAEEGQEFVITRYRRGTQNLRSQLLRILDRAEVAPWPRLFNNLRSSRETELAAAHPIQVVCYWIGNSPKVAADHYLQVREEDYRKAVGSAAQKAAHFPAQQAPATARKDPQSPDINPHFQAEIPLLAASCSPMRGNSMSSVGFEPTTLRLKVACSTN